MNITLDEIARLNNPYLAWLFDQITDDKEPSQDVMNAIRRLIEKD